MFKNYGDITKIDGITVEQVDCIIGGSPCVSFSIAGSRSGFDGASGLFLHQIRLVKEMRWNSKNTYPRYMVLENVVGILTCSKGLDFHRVLMECINVAVKTQKECNETRVPDVPMPKDGKWPKSGILYDDMGRWSIAWRVHDAQYWGVAQRRRRIALVCDFGGMSAPEVLLEQQSVSGNINTCNSQGEGVAKTFTGSSEESDRIWDARGNGNGQLCATLTGDHDNRITDYTNVVVQKPVFCQGGMAVVDQSPFIVDRAAFNQGKNAQFDIKIEETETVPSMIARGPHAVAQPVQYRVRRLTPLECTRLQGLPDHWVDIGDWIDSKGKKHKEADAPKYKALGNAIALPFWKWLCKNIVNKIKEQNKDTEYTPTMASLFAGIGGFDLCWIEATENKDSVLWVSEIEEFPIAVLKYHFS